VIIRVVLPAHLRTLARVNGEVKLDVAASRRSGRSSMRSRPPIRCCADDPRPGDAGTPGVRGFFACEQDLSTNHPTLRLPDAVAKGAEPFLVVGAMAGG